MNEQERGIAKKGLMVNWMIWFALFFSLLIYLGIPHALGDQFQTTPMPVDTFNLLKYALMGVGLVLLAASIMARKAIRISGGQAITTGISSGKKRPPIEQVIQKYSVAVIISLALSEAVGIFGLVLFFCLGFSRRHWS